jgi:ferric iron reductase protein FhuF
MSLLLRAPELAPILNTIDTVGTQRGEAAVHGLTPGLVVEDRTGWLPATWFADGSGLPALLDAAYQRWGAGPAAAATLAWKAYAYWLVLPAVIGYAGAGQVPDMSAGNVLIKLHVSPPFLEVGLRSPRIAVAPGDPLAGRSTVEVTPDLLGYLRRTLIDGHLGPVLDGLHQLARVGRRTLLGSLASGVAYSLTRSADALPGPIAPMAATLLTALGVEQLVEITPQLGVRRRTCCLAFTLPEPKICAGCCLPPSMIPASTIPAST